MSAVARHVVIPAGIVASEWPSVRRTCRRLGWDFDGWQDGAAMLVLSVRADGEYASDTIVISIPRQVGKTYLIGCIIFALCLMKPGLRVIWTAQVKDTALETFEKLVEMASRPKVKPHILKMPQGKGDEAIHFANGSKIEFGARDSGFGRGRTDVDVLVFDEGQHLSLQALENMGAAQNVADNPLCFVMGTPPRPQDKGEYFQVLRQEALDGDSDGTLYIEMSADRGGDPMDRDQWKKANPSFPKRTSERAMLRLRKKLKNEDSWRREAMGVWDEINAGQAVVSPARWRALRGDGPPDGLKPKALALDMSHARQISVAACWTDQDHYHAEEVWGGVDDDACVTWVAKRAGRRMPVMVPDGPAAAMIAPLRARGVRVIQGSIGDMSKACSLLESKGRTARLTHGGQDAVDLAMKDAKRCLIGKNGGWGIDRTDETADVCAAAALVLSLLGASIVTKPKTGRSRESGRRAALA